MSWGIGRRLAIAVMVSAILFPLYWVAVASFTPESQQIGRAHV